MAAAQGPRSWASLAKTDSSRTVAPLTGLPLGVSIRPASGCSSRASFSTAALSENIMESRSKGLTLSRSSLGKNLATEPQAMPKLLATAITSTGRAAARCLASSDFGAARMN